MLLINLNQICLDILKEYAKSFEYTIDTVAYTTGDNISTVEA